MFEFNKKVLVVSLGLFSLVSCNSVTRISGEIIHKKGEPHTYQGDFVFTPDSYAVVTLRQTEGADSSAKIIKKEEIKDISYFPIPFTLQLDKALDFSKSYTYSLSAKVFSQKGERQQVGDLATETVNELKPGQTIVTLETTALESCSSEGAGGFCVSDPEN